MVRVLGAWADWCQRGGSAIGGDWEDGRLRESWRRLWFWFFLAGGWKWWFCCWTEAFVFSCSGGFEAALK